VDLCEDFGLRGLRGWIWVRVDADALRTCAGISACGVCVGGFGFGLMRMLCGLVQGFRLAGVLRSCDTGMQGCLALVQIPTCSLLLDIVRDCSILFDLLRIHH